MRHLPGLLAALGMATQAQAAGIKVVNGDAHFAEGPVWYQGKLYYVEYDRNGRRLDGKKNAILDKQGCGPSAVIPTARGEFRLLCSATASAHLRP
jgi:hypothetical protein